MSDIRDALFITEKITECHRAARRLFGDKFKEKTKGIRDAMQELKDKTGCDNVTAGMEVMKFMEKKDQMSAMLIMLVSAVTYDMANDSEVT